MKLWKAGIAALLIVSFGAVSAQAQNYPTKPITLVVPFAPGGGNDVLARLAAKHMSQTLGQQLIIDNKPGAGGTVGARFVAKAPPDGYTLMVAHSGVMGIGPSFYANPGYDPRKDFAPIGLIASIQYAIVVNPQLPVHNVTELIEFAKKQPGKINYASAGVGSVSHISTELFNQMADVKLMHVPYRGTGPALNDLLGNHVALHMAPIPTLIGMVRGGTLRAIGVTGPNRSPIMPDMPTVTEKALPGYQAVLHYGMLAPEGTPRPIIEKLNAALRAALADDEIRARIVDDGGEPLPGTPEQYVADIDHEETKWGSLVRKLGLRQE
jgi:tripartite-type tricarboxylate transporter receptor subunit TctC